MRNRPFATYNGGKNGSGTYQSIINQIGPHKIFISGFAGNCGVLANKLPAPMANIAIDLDTAVTDAWLKHAGVTAINADSTRYITHLLQSYPAELLPHIFVYLDPPYLSEVRYSKKSYYKHELTDIISHESLLLDAMGWPVRVCISHYPCELYDRTLREWRITDYQARTRQQTRTERLYMNYPPPDQLHDYRYIGDDYRARELFKKMQRNMVDKFHRMPALERNYMIHSLRTAGILD